MVARGNLAEDAYSTGADDEEGGGGEMKMPGGVPLDTLWSFLECDDEADRGEDEEGPSRRSRRRKLRERRSEEGLQQG